MQNSLNHEPKTKKWQFDEEVTSVFDDMLERSIPDYHNMRELVHKLTKKYAKPNTVILDLGCSTGGAIKKAISELPDNFFIGIEVSEPMRQKAKEIFEGIDRVTILNHDLRNGLPKIGEKVSVILSVLTIQFTPIEYRLNIIKDVYKTLSNGGVFIFVEKVLGETSEIDNTLVELYYNLKGENGYTHEKIQKKRKSLEGVLVPVTSSWNIELLRKSGFQNIDCFWRNLNFAGYIAIKQEVGAMS